MKPTFFAKPEAFRAWLEAHHATDTELLVGFYKKGSGRPSITWPESVDEALSFGWIDGVRRGAGDDAYTIRFTPRKPRSIWSTVNVAKVLALRKAGRMRPAGEKAFSHRTEAKTGIYSFERAESAVMSPEEEALMRANKEAAAFFYAQPPGYQRTALHLVTNAKRAETRARRFEQLIADSAAGRRIKQLVAAKTAKPAKRAKPAKPAKPAIPE